MLKRATTDEHQGALTTKWIFEFFFKNRLPIMVLFHICIFILSYLSAFYLEFDGHMPLRAFWMTLPVILSLRILTYSHYRLFQGMFRYTSFYDILNILKGTTLSSAAFLIYLTVFGWVALLWTVFFIDWMIMFALTIAIRIFFRHVRQSIYPFKEKHRTLVVGGIYSGQQIIRHLKLSKNSPYFPIACLDVDASERNLTFHGVPVVGGLENLERLITKYDIHTVMICSSMRYSKNLEQIVKSCTHAECPVFVYIFDSIDNFINDREHDKLVRSVKVEDLIIREPLVLDQENIKKLVKGRTIVVTGAGGSIGSQLCLVLAGYRPEKIVLLERSENNLHAIMKKLQNHFPLQTIEHILGSINDFNGLVNHFKRLHPDYIFHCAAYKHVPLMEDSPIEAAYNNILGTKNVAIAAQQSRVKKFIMVSTDKAVKSTCIMGASKRVAEMVVQALNKGNLTKFVTVRFGNVLNSAGSVIPTFLEQLRNGGPLTVTHPNMERFFMTIPEACQLILQAATIGKGGEIFVLDMQKPVKILDLAEKLIYLSGKVPYKDIPIVFTGIRKGEKITEELFNSEEKPLPTPNKHIWISQNCSCSDSWLKDQIEKIEHCVNCRHEKRLLKRIDAFIAHLSTGPPEEDSLEKDYMPAGKAESGTR